MTTTARAITSATSANLEHPADLPSQVRELRREIFDLNALFEVSRQFHEVWDVDSLLDGILLVAVEHMRVGAAAIATSTPDDNTRLARQRSKGWDLATEPIWSVGLESPWARRLAEYQRPLPVEALIASSSDAGAQIDSMRKAGCVVVAPMVRHEQLRGVLYLAEKVDGASYTSGDFAFLDLLMDQFAVSLDNACLFEREQRANDQLAITKQRLASTEKLAALGQMAATIAHEVRNPAGIIRNYLSLIRPVLHGQPTESGYLDIISEELGRIELFVQSLLGAFNPKRPQPAALSLNAQISEVVAFLRPRLTQQDILIANQLTSAIPSAYAEPEALRQVLLNLILNAIDAMPRGGTITFGASADLDHVHLSIADTGNGIPQEVLDRLFDTYVTTKSENEGTGLGLSICRSLLEHFDGQIGAKNLVLPAHGAVFTIHLRRADSSSRSMIGGPAAGKSEDSE